MEVTIEKIDLLRERANISYSQAQEILEKHNGNVVEALISLESNKKTVKFDTTSSNNSNNYESKQSYNNENFKKHKKTALKWLKKLHFTQLIIGKEQRNIASLPLTIAIPLVLFTLPFSVFVIIGIFVTGHSIAIKKQNGAKYSINEVVDITKERQND